MRGLTEGEEEEDEEDEDEEDDYDDEYEAEADDELEDEEDGYEEEDAEVDEGPDTSASAETCRCRGRAARATSCPPPTSSHDSESREVSGAVDRRCDRDPRIDTRAVQGRCRGHRLHGRADGHSFRGRARRRRQGQPRPLALERDQVRPGLGRTALPGPHPRPVGDRDRGPEPHAPARNPGRRPALEGRAARQAPDVGSARPRHLRRGRDDEPHRDAARPDRRRDELR